MVRQTQANAPMSAALATINLGAEDVHSPSLYQDMIALERSPTKRTFSNERTRMRLCFLLLPFRQLDR